MMRMTYRKYGSKWHVMNDELGTPIWECRTKKEAIAIILSYGQVPIPYVPPAERIPERAADVWEDIQRR